MTDTDRAQYRERTSRTNQDKQAKGPSYTKIITLQLFLCVLILLTVLMVKQFSGPAFEVLKQSYGEIVSHSATGKLLNDNYKAIEDAVQQTFSFLSNNAEEKAGIQDEVPAFSMHTSSRDVIALSSRRMKAPNGATFSPVTVFGKLLYPVAAGTTSCGFGYRTHPVTGKRDFHTGIDIAAPRGTRIMAAVSGTVHDISYSEIYGNTIVLDHGARFYTVYCHCDSIVATIGARIKSGETIALVGDTGLTTGPHLHFEIRKDGLCADPLWIFDRDGLNVL